MQNQDMNRLMQAAKRIGGPLVVTDAQGGEPVVIVPLHDYEQLLDGNTAPAEEIEHTAPLPLPTQSAPSEEQGDIEEGGELPEISEEILNELDQSNRSEIPIIQEESSSIPGEEEFYLEPID